ncbi:diaminopimelate epimerase [Halobacillus shinanisalinarum]|uniref:Diaminopimelate epimerase n=1 Tax=Halobacillus shinanisalinarum TaxID=2932258 RepID=A0ABY4GXM0_9BACI|nr:diaminopimelate epimerase [Halobacillus shinanisalinarum]UOQ92935.1 diaminopimelate epimerase [Halobacillus shinanisalinarum]
MIEFIKCHGSGNDFILIDERTHSYAFSEQERYDLSILLCNRIDGIGSDGILFVMDSSKAEARMRMFNSDGTEAEMCGNGLRCVARYIIEETGKQAVEVETDKAVLAVSQVEPIFSGIDTFAVAIEPVSFAVESLPMKFKASEAVNVKIPELSEAYTFTALSVPNPHIVSIVEDYEEEELAAIGEKANNLPDVFPNGINVSFIKRVNQNKIFVQTFERGVGLTNACGTAMSASALVSTLIGSNQLNAPIVVINKGGLVNCVVTKENGCYSISLQGNATNVYRATIKVDLKELSWGKVDSETFHDEVDTYKKLEDYAKSQI